MSHESDPFEISKAYRYANNKQNRDANKKARRKSMGFAAGSVAASGGAVGAAHGHAHHTEEASFRAHSADLNHENVKFWRDKGRAATYTAEAEQRAGRTENAKLYANEARSYIPKMHANHEDALRQNAKAIKHLAHAKNFKRAAVGAAGAGIGLAAASAYQSSKIKRLQPKSAGLAKALNAAQQKQQKKANRWGMGVAGGYVGAAGSGAVATHNLNRAQEHKWAHDDAHNLAEYHQAAGREATVQARRQVGFGPGHYKDAERTANFARAHIGPMHEARAAEYLHGAKALKSLRNAKVAGGAAAVGVAGMIGAAVKADKEQKKVKTLRTPRTKTPIAKNDPFEISKMSDERLKRQKRAQAKINVAGATLGIGALGALGAGKAARPVLRTAKELGVLRPMVNEAKTDRFVAGAEKVRNTALTVGAGVGGVGGYNSASIMRAEGGKKKKPVQ